MGEPNALRQCETQARGGIARRTPSGHGISSFLVLGGDDAPVQVPPHSVDDDPWTTVRRPLAPLASGRQVFAGDVAHGYAALAGDRSRAAAGEYALELVILADDFTGAGDAAAAFAGGRRVLVVLSASDSRRLWDEARVDVLSVDLDVRELSDDAAQRRAEHVARQLCESSQQARVFLKIDSTLRGPIAGLVAGALAGGNKDVAVIAPAFPEQGRLLREGRVIVDGQPGASLTALLGMDGTALLGAKFVHSPEDVERAVEHARMLGARRIVVDADASDSLANVAAAWQDHPEWLLVGSGGLARQVAGAASTERRLRAPVVSRPVLVVAGSPTPMTAAQIEQLRGLGSIVTLRPGRGRPVLPSAPGGLLVLCTPAATQRDAGEAAHAIAETVAEWSRTLVPGAVVLAGGATARRVCERLGAAGVRLAGELSPGVPIGRLVGGTWDQVLVVTKAGGFGTPTTLLDAVRSVGVSSSYL